VLEVRIGLVHKLSDGVGFREGVLTSCSSSLSNAGYWITSAIVLTAAGRYSRNTSVTMYIY
jgi:hypothetical protein